MNDRRDSARRHWRDATATDNPLMGTGNYGATSNNIKLVHWPL